MTIPIFLDKLSDHLSLVMLESTESVRYLSPGVNPCILLPLSLQNHRTIGPGLWNELWGNRQMTLISQQKPKVYNIIVNWRALVYCRIL